MKREIIFLITFTLFCSCDQSKWITIRGNGIDHQPKSINEVIYFENENRGVIGGYTLISDSLSKNEGKLSFIPIMFITNDGGKNWTEIIFEKSIKQSVRKAYLHRDTLICKTDSLILLSIDNGNHFIVIKDSGEIKMKNRHHFKDNRYDIKNHTFKYEGSAYYIKEYYTNNLSSVIVCYGSESLTDYYFVSFNKGKSWTFLQKTFGDNRERFLLQDKYLYCYHFPFGLQRLPLR